MSDVTLSDEVITEEEHIKRYEKETQKPKVTIIWGSDREITKTYVFENETQKAFFMKGVDEANGWLEYEEVEQGHETISFVQSNNPISRVIP